MKKNKLILIEIVRIISSWSVLLWHYHNFKFLNITREFDSAKQPLYNIFSIFYRHGGDGIYSFWVVSGFIFFYTYGKSIAEKKQILKNIVSSGFRGYIPYIFSRSH